MTNTVLRLSYDGTAYHGWQVQKNDRSVAQTEEQALAGVYKQQIHLTGCGRTDAGVHALMYCANYHAPLPVPAERIPLALNAYLPWDISVSDAMETDDSFNAIGSCIKKEYIYLIHNSKIRNPFWNNRVCFYPQDLDGVKMAEAAKAFEGTHDFRAVRSVGTETKTTVRTVHSCRVEREGELIRIAVCADGFLYNMCRAIVGTIVYASYGKLSPEEIPHLLELGDRRLTGPTMPPQGLYLNRVWYDGPVMQMFTNPSHPFT